MASDREPARSTGGALLASLVRVLVWGGRTGAELLGMPCSVLITEDGLGFTRKETDAVRIWVNPEPILGGHPQGEDLVRGLILHELGHNLYDFGEHRFERVTEIAQRRGVRKLLNILRDERLERRLRARRPEWGQLLDRLAAWAFNHRIRAGGPVSEGDQFLRCLRMGLGAGRAPAERVRQALTSIPADLVSRDQDGLLDVAFELARVVPELEDDRAEKLRKRLEGHNLGRAEPAHPVGGECGQSCRPLSASRARRRLAAETREALARTLEAEADRVRTPARRGPGEGPMTGKAPADPSPRPAWNNAGRAVEGRPLNTVTVKWSRPGHVFARPSLSLSPFRRSSSRLRRALVALFARQARIETVSEDRIAGARLQPLQARKLLVGDPHLCRSTNDEYRPSTWIGITIGHCGCMQMAPLEAAKELCHLLFLTVRAVPGFGLSMLAGHDAVLLDLGDERRSDAVLLGRGVGRCHADGTLGTVLDLAGRRTERLRMLLIVSHCPACSPGTSMVATLDRLERSRKLLTGHVLLTQGAGSFWRHSVILGGMSGEALHEAFSTWLIGLARIGALWRSG